MGILLQISCYPRIVPCSQRTSVWGLVFLEFPSAQCCSGLATLTTWSGPRDLRNPKRQRRTCQGAGKGGGLHTHKVWCSAVLVTCSPPSFLTAQRRTKTTVIRQREDVTGEGCFFTFMSRDSRWMHCIKIITRRVSSVLPLDDHFLHLSKCPSFTLFSFYHNNYQGFASFSFLSVSVSFFVFNFITKERQLNCRN